MSCHVHKSKIQINMGFHASQILSWISAPSQLKNKQKLPKIIYGVLYSQFLGFTFWWKFHENSKATDAYIRTIMQIFRLHAYSLIYTDNLLWY